MGRRDHTTSLNEEAQAENACLIAQSPETVLRHEISLV